MSCYYATVLIKLACAPANVPLPRGSFAIAAVGEGWVLVRVPDRLFPNRDVHELRPLIGGYRLGGTSEEFLAHVRDVDLATWHAYIAKTYRAPLGAYRPRPIP